MKHKFIVSLIGIVALFQGALASAAVYSQKEMVLTVHQNVNLAGNATTTVSLSTMTGGTRAIGSREYRSTIGGVIPNLDAGGAPGTFSSSQAAIEWLKNRVDGSGLATLNEIVLANGAGERSGPSNQNGNARVSAVFNAIDALSAQYNARMAVFSYSRSVQITNIDGTVENHKVGINWHKPENGEMRSDGYSIDPSRVIGILRVQYEQDRMAEKTPDDWKHADGGKVRYRAYKLDLLGGAGIVAADVEKVVDVAGAYDEPDYTTAGASDRDTGLNRLAYEWLPGMMKTTNTQIAIISYGRVIGPVFK